MVVDGKVELIMAVHVDDIVIAGSDETCRDFHAALTTKFPTNNLDELTWYTGCACLLYTSPSPRDQRGSRMPSSA